MINVPDKWLHLMKSSYGIILWWKHMRASRCVEKKQDVQSTPSPDRALLIPSNEPLTLFSKGEALNIASSSTEYQHRSQESQLTFKS